MLNISNTVLPHHILKSRSTKLLDAITVPDKLANDLSAVDLISVCVKNKVLDVSIHDNYKRASKLVNEVLTSLRVFNDPDVLINFCNVLKSQDDPKLLRIANDNMLVDIGKYHIFVKSVHIHNDLKMRM